MYSRYYRITALLLSVVMSISFLTGCGSKEIPQSQPEESEPVVLQTSSPVPEPTPEATPEPLREELFTKTVWDFPDYPVETFDEVGETNFIVYQKELKQLSVDENTNVLLEADFDNQIFVFDNPDESLVNCQAGDTFLLPNNGFELSGFAFNVESSEMNGNTITIKGSQPSMEEIFAYAEVTADISLDQYAASADNSSAENSGSFSLQDIYVSENMPLGIVLSESVNADFGVVDITVTPWISYDNLHLEMYFFPEECYLYTDCWVDSNYGFSLDVGAEGDSGTTVHDSLSVNLSPKPIPVPVGAALGIQFDPTAEIDFSGKLSGNLTWKAAGRSGYNFSCGWLTELVTPHLTWQQIGEPETNINLKKLEGKCSFALDFKLFVGIKNVGEIYASPVVGVEFVGKPDDTAGKTEEGVNIDYVHDCDLCVDGDTEPFFEMRLGAHFCLKKSVNGVKGVYPRVEGTLPRFVWNKGDFYISKTDGEFEWGFEECPHKRYRCTVEVGDKDRYKLAGAAVTAKYEDGRTENKTTGKDGYALVYLPYGAHMVSASKGGGQGSKIVTMGKEPISVLILINNDKDIYFKYSIEKEWGVYGTIDDFPELKQLMLDKYPYIKFCNVKSDDYTSENEYEPGDIIISCGIERYSLALSLHIWGGDESDYILFYSSGFKDYADGTYASYCYRIDNDFSCNTIFDDNYHWIYNENPIEHDHSGFEERRLLNIPVTDELKTKMLYNIEIEEFETAKTEHVKSLLPLVDEIINENWPVCKVMVHQ